jgi:hypothetical protein
MNSGASLITDRSLELWDLLLIQFPPSNHISAILPDFGIVKARRRPFRTQSIAQGEQYTSSESCPDIYEMSAPKIALRVFEFSIPYFLDSAE